MEFKTKLIGALTTLAIAGACLAPMYQAHVEKQQHDALLEKAQQRQEQLARLIDSKENVKSYLTKVANQYNLSPTQTAVLEAAANSTKADIYPKNIQGYESDADIVQAAQDYAQATNLRHLLVQFKPGTEMFKAVKALQDTTNIDIKSAVETVMNANHIDEQHKLEARAKYDSEHQCEKQVSDVLAHGGRPGFTCG